MITIVLFGLVAIVLITRITSGQASTSVKLRDGDRTVPAIPHWIPYLGHIFQLILYPGHFLRRIKAHCTNGLCYLSLGGTYHACIFAPAFAAHLLAQPSLTVADPRPVTRYFIRYIFGLPKADLAVYDPAASALAECDAHFSQPDQVIRGRLTHAVVQQLKTCSHDFVSFCPSPVDQTSWERISKVALSSSTASPDSDDPVADADLILLIKNFVAHVMLTSLLGPDFVRLNPHFASDLWSLDRSLTLLATGLPRWTPLPPLTRAHLTLRRLLHALKTFKTQNNSYVNGVDPTSEWSDLDQVSEYMQSRHDIYRRFGLSADAAASLDLAIIWSLVANAANMAVWLVLHVFADRSVHRATRFEIDRDIVRLSDPLSDGAFPGGISQPRRIVDIDVEALSRDGRSSLKSMYDHVLKLYSWAWDSRLLRKDLLLSSTQTTANSHWKAPTTSKTGSFAETYLLKQGTIVHIPRGSQATLDKHASDVDLQAQLTPRIYSFGIFGQRHPASVASASTSTDGCTEIVKMYVMLCTASIISLWDVWTAQEDDADPTAASAAAAVAVPGTPTTRPKIKIPPAANNRLFGIKTPVEADYRALLSRRRT